MEPTATTAERFPAWREVREPDQGKREEAAAVAGHVVSRGLISTVVRGDAPPDSGYGISYAGETPVPPDPRPDNFNPFPTLP